MSMDLTELFAQAHDLVDDAEAKLPVLARRAEWEGYVEYDEYMFDIGEAAFEILSAIVREIKT